MPKVKNNPITTELLNEFNWDCTPLGHPDLWPQSLKTSVSICLTSKFPAMVLWGPEMIQIYNDGYSDVIGLKHPSAFGARAEVVWKEIWNDIGPMLHSVLEEGESVLLENHPFILNRKGYSEQCYFSFSYNPILNGSAIEGVFVSVNETTAIMLSDENLRKLRDKHLKNLFIQAPIGLAILRGPSHVVEVANQQILKLWGKAAEEVMEKPVFDAIPEAKNQGYEDLLDSVFHNGERIVIQESPLSLIRYGKHENFFIKLTYEPLREEDGSISGIMVLADEITEQVMARRNLEESELQQRIAIEAAQIGTFDIDLQSSGFQFSERLAHIFGYESNTGVGRNDLVNRIYPDDLNHRQLAHQMAIETGTLFYEARILWPDKSIRWFRANGKVVYDSAGKPWRMFGTTLDITDEKTQSERLEKLVAERTASLKLQHEEFKRSEERYHKMIDEVQDYAIIMLDKDGIIQNWNKGAEKIKQYKEQEVVGRHFRIFYLPGDRADRVPERLLKEAATTGRAVHEGWRLRRDQTRFWGSIAITALHDNDGSIIGYSKVTRDLTQRKEAEDKLREYSHELEKRNQELEQFAYVASHDLQEPLRKIQTFVDLIHRNLPNEELVSKYLVKTDLAAQRMSELIKSVLSYSKLSKDDQQINSVDLNSLLKEVVQDFELSVREKNAAIQIDPLPTVTAVELQLHQLFSNLVSNALKFSSGNPAIHISSRTVSKEEVLNTPDHLMSQHYFEITFADNGIGFDQHLEKHVFTMFQRLHNRREYPGTGIGLAICKKIVENHHGYITVKSEIGQGTTFYLYFPTT